MLKKRIVFFFNWAKKERNLVTITSFVILFHLSLCLYSLSPKSTYPSKKNIVVHTSTALKQATYQPLTQKPLSKKKISSSLKQKTADGKKRALKKVEESFSKLEKMQQEKADTLTLSTPRLIVQAESGEKEEQNSYIKKLTACLQKNLELPERGKVQLTLTITGSGLIKNLKILASESKKNQHYIETHLPLLKCPSFTEDWEKARENTVTITFCNEPY